MGGSGTGTGTGTGTGARSGHGGRLRAALIGVALAALAAACAGESGELRSCRPGARTCAGAQVLECRDDGQGYETLHSCTGAYACRDGECVPRSGDAAGDAAGGPDAGGPDAGADAAGGRDVGDTGAATGPDAARDGGGGADAPDDGGAPPDAPTDAREPPPLCGNGVRDPGELCDPEAPPGTPGECPTECAPGAGCVARALEGAAADCTAHCRTYTVTAAGPLDGCCPGGAGPADDADCPVTCGDGVLQPDERCDPGIGAGAIGHCPAGCAASSGCDGWRLDGAAAECTARCLLVPITEVGPADGCCPEPQGFGADPDCPDPCGDGILQEFEACDRGIGEGALGSCPTACPPAEPCRGWTYEGSVADCTAACAERVVAEVGPADGCCPAGGTAETDADCVPVCGNGRVEAGEDCDGAAPAGMTCSSLGFGTAGWPACTDRCDLDTFPCGGHELVYAKITAVPPVTAARGSYVDVAWFPDGTAAVVVTETGALLRYDVETAAVTVLAEDLADSIVRLATLPVRDAVLALGYDRDGDGDRTGRAFLLTDPTAPGGAPVPLPTLDLAGVALVAVAVSPDETEAVVGGYDDPNHITHLYHVETAGWTVLAHGAFASFDGLSDVTWAHVPAGDPRFVLTFAGPTGADSHSWYLDFGEAPQPNGWSPGMGNAGRGGWRPGGRYALAAAATSEKLYVFTYEDAVSWDWWTAGNIPGYTTDFRGVYWHPRGHRALATGRPTDLPRVGRIVEVIPRGPAFDDTVDLRAADIVGYTDPPFSAGESAHLHAAAWRPGPCEEGLIVGDDDGPSWAPTFGLLIRFVDGDDEDCEP